MEKCRYRKLQWDCSFFWLISDQALHVNDSVNGCSWTISWENILTVTHGIIDCEEKDKELDEQLKLIKREDFFTRRSVEEAISKEEEIVELKDVNVNEALDSFENVKAFNESIFLI